MTITVPTLIKSGPLAFAGSSAFQLNGVENTRLNPNRKVQTQIAAGQISPSFIYMNSAEPMVTSTITELGLAIAGGMTPVLGLAGSSAAINTVTVYGTNTLQLGSVAGASAHFTTTVNLGVCVLKSIKAAQGQKATGSIEVHAIWDGTNDPFVFATNASLPASVLIQQEYTLGPCYMDGSALVGVKDVSIEMGIQQIKVQSDGNLYPTLTYTATYAPVVTLTMTNAAAMSTFGLIGTATLHGRDERLSGAMRQLRNTSRNRKRNEPYQNHGSRFASLRVWQRFQSVSRHGRRHGRNPTDRRLFERLHRSADMVCGIEYRLVISYT